MHSVKTLTYLPYHGRVPKKKFCDAPASAPVYLQDELRSKIGNMENDNEENAIQKLPNFHMSFSYSFFLKSVRVKSVTLRQIK